MVHFLFCTFVHTLAQKKTDDKEANKRASCKGFSKTSRKIAPKKYDSCKKSCTSRTCYFVLAGYLLVVLVETFTCVDTRLAFVNLFLQLGGNFTRSRF